MSEPSTLWERLEPEFPGFSTVALPAPQKRGGLEIREARHRIAETAKTLLSAKFPCDPLFPPSLSLQGSLMESAKKRHGLVIEAAVRDAAATSRCCTRGFIKGNSARREIDVLLYRADRRQLLALDVKRGCGRHDSGKRRDMLDTAAHMQKILPVIAADHAWDVASGITYAFLHYYSDCDASHVHGWSLEQLRQFLLVDVRAFVERATDEYRAAVLEIIQQRTGYAIGDCENSRGCPAPAETRLAAGG